MLNKLLKKTVTSFLILYSFNILAPTVLNIPINILTLSVVYLFNLVGLIIILVLKILII